MLAPKVSVSIKHIKVEGRHVWLFKRGKNGLRGWVMADAEVTKQVLGSVTNI